MSEYLAFESLWKSKAAVHNVQARLFIKIIPSKRTIKIVLGTYIDVLGL
jgi:hypothetical protein